MAMAIGYNVKEANELMKNIAKAYNDLGLYAKEQWNPVVNCLQAEWVGDDEQDFEKKLAKRICDLYVNSYELVKVSLNQIEGTVNAWAEFQANNTIDGVSAESISSIKVDAPSVKEDSEIVKAKNRHFSQNDDRGLATESSKTTIKTAVSDFVSAIKAKTQGLFENIDTSSAFFGEQSSSIKTYIEKVGVAIGEVTVAIKDMNDALDTLASSSYTSASTDVGTSFTTASSSVDESLGSLGNSRWV